MSMLTPPGMGGKYRITGDKYPRMRRPRNRRRIVTAVIAAVVALGLAGWGTLQLIDVFFLGDDTKATAATGRKTGCKPGPGASPAPPVTLKPGQVTVNVYNATPRGGLAKAAADELKKRGFTIGKIGNAPAAYDKKIPGAGILLGAPAAAKGPFSVLNTQLPAATTKTDTRTTKDVDLILGTAFTALSPKPTADRALTALAKPTPSPSATC